MSAQDLERSFTLLINKDMEATKTVLRFIWQLLILILIVSCIIHSLNQKTILGYILAALFAVWGVFQFFRIEKNIDEE